MSTAVHKYILTPRAQFNLPLGSEVLSVINQREEIVMYVRVPLKPEGFECRTFWTYGTGHPIEVGREHLFIGTVALDNANLVFHVFEVI